jgi:hypothetical protein
VKRQKPNNVTNEEWEAINKAIQVISEHFSNTGLFINWVDEEGETQNQRKQEEHTTIRKSHKDTFCCLEVSALASA